MYKTETSIKQSPSMIKIKCNEVTIANKPMKTTEPTPMDLA